jgi:hypothetical protein
MNIKVNVDFKLAIILTIIFMILKLMNYITWSWIWVISPIWITIIIAIILLLIVYYINTRRRY